MAEEKKEEGRKYDYDFVVIGGGSGGLSAAKNAARLNAKVALFDFVRPTPIGTTWGLGGTCVNVGCIPKKLFHQAALLGDNVEDAKKYGWDVEKKGHNWSKLIDGILDHISSLNWGYRAQLTSDKVKYYNARARFVEPHKLECTDRAGDKFFVTGEKFLIAVGGRPSYPRNTPGAEKCITSDDLFSMEKAPGKTLVVGASYVALECAGFLAGLGYDTTVMVRSIFLRGFDQQIAEQIGKYMGEHGTKFIRPATISKIEHLEDGKKKVTWKQGEDEGSDVFDTVLFAIGRNPETKYLNLDAAGVKLNAKGKIEGENEQTNVDHIYALGDIYVDKKTGRSLELTPVAIKAGQFLARRLFSDSTIKMDYNHVPTTVFTPLEYGAIGRSEEEAEKDFKKENVEVYHAYYQPLEWTVASRPAEACYLKIITNKADDDRIVGYHVLGPHAGEVTQGFALGFKLGATKADLDQVVGIHPTIAEEATTLETTKSSGESAVKTGC